MTMSGGGGWPRPLSALEHPDLLWELAEGKVVGHRDEPRVPDLIAVIEGKAAALEVNHGADGSGVL